MHTFITPKFIDPWYNLLNLDATDVKGKKWENRYFMRDGKL